MNQYETMIIFTPVLSTEELDKSVKKYTDLVKDNGGKIVHEERWGLQPLAYSIDKKTTGIYCLLETQHPGEFNDALQTAFRRDEQVMRFMVTKMDKYAIKYAGDRREKIKESKKKDKQKAETEKAEA